MAVFQNRQKRWNCELHNGMPLKHSDNLKNYYDIECMKSQVQGLEVKHNSIILIVRNFEH